MFWEKVDINGILSDPYLIFCGDLNLTLFAGEFLGGCSEMDKMEGFFKQFFMNSNMMDVIHTKLAPTWRNGRVRNDEVRKIL